MKIEVGHKYNLLVSYAETEYIMNITSLNEGVFTIDFCVTSIGNGTVTNIALGDKFTTAYGKDTMYGNISDTTWVITKHINIKLDEDLFIL